MWEGSDFYRQYDLTTTRATCDAGQRPSPQVEAKDAWVWEAGYTLTELTPFSPDLNPIEIKWSYAKNYVEHHHARLDQGRQRPGERARQIVNEAYVLGFNEDDMENLIDSMPEESEPFTELKEAM